MDQKAADELVDSERQKLVASGALGARRRKPAKLPIIGGTSAN
jgi:hypothetical protein